MAEGDHQFRFGGDGDYTDDLASAGQHIEFFHLVSGKSVFFKAFITQFEDGFDSDWNEEDAYGRMDPISTFKKTRRKITLAWDVPAASAEEAKENLRKCSLLAAMHYPSYELAEGTNNPARTIKSPPLFRLKLFNLIESSESPGGTAEFSGLLGYTSGFRYSPDFTEQGGVFGPSKDSPRKVYARLVRLTCTFTVLHLNELGWDENGKSSESFSVFPYSVDNRNESKDLPERTPGYDEEDVYHKDREIYNLDNAMLKGKIT